MRIVRTALGLAAAALGLAAVSALTRAPYDTHATGAVLRLSWRVRGEEVERCRRATAAELANVPEHMRQEVVCDGRRVAPYRVRAAIDGREVVGEAAPGSGVAGDRPMFLLRDLPLAPGVHRVEVRLERVGAARESHDTLDASAGSAPLGRARRRSAIPPRLVLDTVVRVAPQTIALVTYESELRRLVLLSASAAAR